jgi:hypothetical protein
MHSTLMAPLPKPPGAGMNFAEDNRQVAIAHGMWLVVAMAALVAGG